MFNVTFEFLDNLLSDAHNMHIHAYKLMVAEFRYTDTLELAVSGVL